MMYSPQKVVGDFFEERLMRIFDLVKVTEFDLMSKNGTFYVEVKASAYDNGGVINKKQLYTFDRKIVKRFYAFAYNPISVRTNMQSTYPTPAQLKKALALRSLFLFPFSIIRAYFERTPTRVTGKHDDFVQLNEKNSEAIFSKEAEIWERLGLPTKTYKTARPHEKVHIMTREGNLEQEILRSFNPAKV